MRKSALIRELWQHRRLAEKRSVLYNKSKASKYIYWVVGAIFAAYLIIVAILMAMAAIEDRIPYPSEFFATVPVFFFLDFWIRFLVQQTPMQMVRPYVLLPISKYACIDAFILRQTFSWGNFIWLFLFIPYAVMTILFREGAWVMIGFVLASQLCMLISAHLYMFVRTRIQDSIFWLALPIAFFVVLALPLYLEMDIYEEFGKSVARFNPLCWLLLIGVFSSLFLLNRREQYTHVMKELSRAKNPLLKHINRYQFLDCFGFVGQYMKLELKMLMRNKHPRKLLIYMIALLALFCGLVCMGVYQDSFGKEFWCLYLFSMFGGTMLQRIMMYEGNFIDFLMLHRENIYNMLLAKYYFYTAMLCFPMLLCIPPVILGYWSLLQCVAYLLYAAGPIYFGLFQMAVYNNQTLALDAALMTRTHGPNAGAQTIFSLLALAFPITLCLVIEAFLSNTVAHVVLLFVSIPFFLTHRWWLKNIYRRMMSRRYQNLESFHQTR